MAEKNEVIEKQQLELDDMYSERDALINKIGRQAVEISDLKEEVGKAKAVKVQTE